MSDQVNHPKHYNSGACADVHYILVTLGVSEKELAQECIEVLERHQYGFHIGNAVKYLWRCGSKGKYEEDLKKALWYLQRYVQWRSTRFWLLRVLFREDLSRVQAAIEMIVDEIP